MAENVRVTVCRQWTCEFLHVRSAKPQPCSTPSGHNAGEGRPPWGHRPWESRQVTPRLGTQALSRACPKQDSPHMEMPFSFFVHCCMPNNWECFPWNRFVIPSCCTSFVLNKCYLMGPF